MQKLDNYINRWEASHHEETIHSGNTHWDQVSLHSRPTMVSTGARPESIARLNWTLSEMDSLVQRKWIALCSASNRAFTKTFRATSRKFGRQSSLAPKFRT